MPKVTVHPKADEALQAGIIGLKRRISSCDQGFADRKKCATTNWEGDIEGAIGEFVVAKFLGIPWQAGINTFHAPDVGDIQVRTTHHLTGKLIVREEDSNDEVYVLVTGTYPTYHICGWMRGKECKQDKWVYNPNDRGNAWFVPQSDLHSPYELKGAEAPKESNVLDDLFP